VKLILDSSVWIEHLRYNALQPLWPRIRTRYQHWMHALVAGELLAGCRSSADRSEVDDTISPFSRVGRVVTASAAEIVHGGRTLSRLRERGISLANPAGALLDATIAVTTARLGALLVTENARDFEKLAKLMPLRWETLSEFAARTSA
jgi:predicted nucleic acid-binding protein